MLEPKEIDNYFRINGPRKTTSGKQALQHTRWVTLIKLALPGLAAVLAVTLLVFPSLKDDAREFSLDFMINRGDIEKLNIENTTIYVTDAKNRVSNFVAEQIKETEPGSQEFDLINPEAIMPMENSEWISIQAPRGKYVQESALLCLQEHVENFYSRGMSLQTAEAFFDFKKSFGYSHKPVTGDGFLGKVASEGFEISADKDTLTFLGKTRIVIDEENLRKD